MLELSEILPIIGAELEVMIEPVESTFAPACRNVSAIVFPVPFVPLVTNAILSDKKLLRSDSFSTPLILYKFPSVDYSIQVGN